MNDKFSLVLLLIHWIDCCRGKVNVASIMAEFKAGWHIKGGDLNLKLYGSDITLNEEEVQSILDSLKNFAHIREQSDHYTVNPLGRSLRESHIIGEFSYHPFAGKLPMVIE